jgi:hypothetical protein
MVGVEPPWRKETMMMGIESSFLIRTAHGARRMAQRGISAAGVALASLIGTEVEGVVLVREKDFQVLDRELKQLRDHAKRLVGKRLVIEAGCLVTVYHSTHAKERRLLRDAQDKSLME